MAPRKLDMHEGPQAWERFRKTMEAIMSLRKEALPPKRRNNKAKEKAQSAPQQ